MRHSETEAWRIYAWVALGVVATAAAVVSGYLAWRLLLWLRALQMLC